MQDLNGGPFGSFRNKIIGGDFGTNPWQRGTNFSAFTVATYLADRWVFENSSTGGIAVAPQLAVPTVAQAGRLVTKSFLATVIQVDAAVAAGDVAFFEHRIEGYNFQSLAQKPMVLSFWHAHSKAGIYCVAFRSSNGDRSFLAEYTQSVSGVWEYTRIVISPSPAAGTWDYTNGIGLRVAFIAMCGTNAQTTPGVWQTGNFLGTANQVNFFDTLSNNFFLALVQLESGTVATPFEGRSFQEELALCQRYFSKSYDNDTAIGTITRVGCIQLGSYANTPTTMNNGVGFRFPVPMRNTPAVSALDPDAGTIGFLRWDAPLNGATQGPGILTAIGNTGVGSVTTTFAGLVAGQGLTLLLHYTASAEL